MSDWIVTALVYEVRHGRSLKYDRAPPLTVDEPDFSVTVDDDKARFEFKREINDEKEAHEIVAEYVRQWEFSSTLRRGPDAFTLHFLKSEGKEKNPVPGQHRVRPDTVRYSFEVPSVAVTVRPASFPEPPSGIKITPDVQSMFDRYVGHCRGHEPLDTMAYFCLTMVEWSARCGSGKRGSGNRNLRKKAAAKYNVAKKVLHEIGNLSAKERKVDAESRELTGKERSFLRNATVAIIRRMAENAHDPSTALRQIKMADFGHKPIPSDRPTPPAPNASGS